MLKYITFIWLMATPATIQQYRMRSAYGCTFYCLHILQDYSNYNYNNLLYKTYNTITILQEAVQCTPSNKYTFLWTETIPRFNIHNKKFRLWLYNEKERKKEKNISWVRTASSSWQEDIFGMKFLLLGISSSKYVQCRAIKAGKNILFERKRA